MSRRYVDCYVSTSKWGFGASRALNGHKITCYNVPLTPKETLGVHVQRRALLPLSNDVVEDVSLYLISSRIVPT